MANVDAFNAGWDSVKGGGKKASEPKPKKSPKQVKQVTTSDNQTLIPSEPMKDYPSHKRGGKVRKTGLAKLHKGELVLTAAQAKQCAAKKGKSKSGAQKRLAAKR